MTSDSLVLGRVQLNGDSSQLVAAVEAVHATYRETMARMQMQLIVYRQTLIDHGIEPPDNTGEELMEMYHDCRAVITTASEFVGRLRSAKELLT